LPARELPVAEPGTVLPFAFPLAGALKPFSMRGEKAKGNTVPAISPRDQA
jgi:hypothetical protein